MTASTSDNLVTLIAARVARDPDGVALVLLIEDGTRETFTAERLWAEAGRAAANVQGLGIEPEDVVLIALPHGPAIATCFLGALRAGVVPALVAYPPPRFDAAAYAARVQSMATLAGARAVVTWPAFRETLASVLEPIGCRTIGSDELAAANGCALAPVVPRRDALCFLQYTSGTTGLHKVVAHTNAAVAGYLAAKLARGNMNPADVSVSWLPLYHDLGLISAFLTPLVAGSLIVLMSPFHWVREPRILMRAITDYRGTLTWMPNAGLNHCTMAIRDADLEGVDLGTLRAVGSGGEPVRVVSIRMFEQRFRPYGLKDSAVQVGYGMAENVEGVTNTGGRDFPVTVDWIDVRALEDTRRAVPAEPCAAGSASFVSCGAPFRGVEVRVVDDDGRDLPERHVGEIIVRAPYLLSGGYYRRPDLTAEAMRDEWFQTGDLGYLAAGDLYVCGRKKDLIIVGGRNIYPDDLEMLTNAVPGVAQGRAVAFGVPDARTGTDRVVVVCEVRPDADPAAVTRELRRRAASDLDVTVSEVRIVPRGWILKTSSGKLARSANREKYLDDKAPADARGAPVTAAPPSR